SDSGDDADFEFDNPAGLSGVHYHPKMLRLWNWLMICDDGTVISIHEPIPPLRGASSDHPDVKNMYKHVRRNLRTVLRCLSGAEDCAKEWARRSAEERLEMGAPGGRETVRTNKTYG